MRSLGFVSLLSPEVLSSRDGSLLTLATSSDCFEAGMSLMTGHQVNGIRTWGSVMNHDSGILLAPGLAVGVGLLLFVQRVHHPAALPVALVTIPVMFYIVLVAGGFSMEEARSAYGEGWLDKESKQAEFWQVWDPYKFNLVQVSVYCCP